MDYSLLLQLLGIISACAGIVYTCVRIYRTFNPASKSTLPVKPTTQKVVHTLSWSREVMISRKK
jgi:hypothetical protein